MTIILAHHHVKDYSAWKKVFDTNLAFRKSGGELSAKIYQDQKDSNSLTIINTWDTMENAQRFFNSPDLKAAMEKSGVVGMPDFHYLNEATA